MKSAAPMAVAVRMAAVAAAMLLLWPFLPATGNESESQTVVITIRHSRFIPERFTVRRGMTIRFVITNTDPIDHEFILGDEGVQQLHETGTDPKHDTVPGEVSVPPGETAETTYTFSQPGLLLIGCHAPGHYSYRMRGSVWVAGR